jgi:hypothetical protein
MSPFAVVAVLLLTLLFVLLSTVDILFGQSDMDSFDPPPQVKTKTAS